MAWSKALRLRLFSFLTSLRSSMVCDSSKNFYRSGTGSCSNLCTGGSISIYEEKGARLRLKIFLQKRVRDCSRAPACQKSLPKRFFIGRQVWRKYFSGNQILRLLLFRIDCYPFMWYCKQKGGADVGSETISSWLKKLRQSVKIP